MEIRALGSKIGRKVVEKWRSRICEGSFFLLAQVFLGITKVNF